MPPPNTAKGAPVDSGNALQIDRPTKRCNPTLSSHGRARQASREIIGWQNRWAHWLRFYCDWRDELLARLQQQPIDAETCPLKAEEIDELIAEAEALRRFGHAIIRIHGIAPVHARRQTLRSDGWGRWP